MTLNIGAHMSIAKGYSGASKSALSIGANTFQFFTRNPRGGKAKALDIDDINIMKKIMTENNFSNLLAHAPYTLNMASANENTREFANQTFRADLDIINNLPCELYNFHPGSFTSDSLETGIERIIKIINDNLREEDSCTVLLETMSGKGTEIGRNFNELKDIIDGVDLKDKIGVCMDTCHVYCAGYDIKNDLDGVLEDFDKILGIERLKAVHLNDTQNDIGTNKDRHAKLGEGFIGLSAMTAFVNHPSIKKLPMFLETPNELDGYEKEIEILKNSVS